MRASRSCKYDSEIYAKVKTAVSMRQIAEYCGLQVNKKGLCLCPFHQDKNPSMKIYPNGKGFYCFTCGAGGDQISFMARYRDISNHEAARELAAAFQVPIQEPVTYREKRETELARRRRCEIEKFKQHAKLWLRMYWILLCEARRDPDSPHFAEAVRSLDHVEYMLDCLEQYPDAVYADKKAVRKIGEVERRVIGWHNNPETDGAVPG